MPFSNARHPASGLRHHSERPPECFALEARGVADEDLAAQPAVPP